MSAYTPPTYSVTPFNPAYFTSAASTSGISLADATALFLLKTSTDTATALETFTAGIATNSVGTTTLASNLILGSATNTGTASLDTTGNITIGGSQVSGTLTVGDLGTRTGAITIGGSSTSTVPITIGNTAAASTTTIRNPIMSYSYSAIPTYVSGQIGFKTIGILNTVGGNPLTLNALATAISTASCPIGIYLVEYSLRLVGTSASCNLTAFMSYINSLGSTPSTQPLLYGQFGIGTTTKVLPSYANGDDNYFACNGSAVINQTAAGAFSLIYKAQASAGVSFFNLGVANNPVRPMTYICATRIA